MASSRKASWTALACAASSLAAAGTALAAQGPGTGPGTASVFMQTAMAVLLYGVAALVVATGLVGSIWRH